MSMNSHYCCRMPRGAEVLGAAWSVAMISGREAEGGGAYEYLRSIDWYPS